MLCRTLDWGFKKLQSSSFFLCYDCWHRHRQRWMMYDSNPEGKLESKNKIGPKHLFGERCGAAFQLKFYRHNINHIIVGWLVCMPYTLFLLRWNIFCLWISAKKSIEMQRKNNANIVFFVSCKLIFVFNVIFLRKIYQ